MPEDSQDWADGFLVVGNHPALDLLNTKLWVNDAPLEMLTDTSALIRWLVVSGFVTGPVMKKAIKDWHEEAEAKTFLRQLLRFREELRDAVLRLEEGKQPAPAFVAELNKLLFAYPVRQALIAVKGEMQTIQTLGPSIADTVWAALLNATTELLTITEKNRIRKCESCVVHFRDDSKKNARRWCSMRLCGNRVKVAAYQQRQRRQVSNTR